MRITATNKDLREDAFTLLLSRYGVNYDDYSAISIIVFFVTYLLTGLLGGILEARKYFWTG